MTAQLEGLLPQELTEVEGTEEMASDTHSAVTLNLASNLHYYVKAHKFGRVFESSATFKMVGEPKTRQADVSFVLKEKLPELLDENIPFAPDLAVEVVSKNDTQYDIKTKVQHYLNSGTQLIWFITPLSRTVDIYRPATGLVGQEMGITEYLDGENLIPGFKMAVAELFDY
jgi:Uma2 family endonuclease